MTRMKSLLFLALVLACAHPSWGAYRTTWTMGQGAARDFMKMRSISYAPNGMWWIDWFYFVHYYDTPETCNADYRSFELGLCEDLHDSGNCQHYKNEGFCKGTYELWMNIYCLKMCGRCPPDYNYNLIEHHASMTGPQLKQLDVGTNVVWAVGRDGSPYFRKGITDNYPMGDKWQQVNGKKTQITVSPNGYVWAVNKDDTIYYRVGSGPNGRVTGGDYWKQVGGKLRQIAAGSVGIWGVNSGGNLYYRKGTYGDKGGTGTGRTSAGSGWTQVPFSGGVSYVSDTEGSVVVFGKDKHLYKREGITASNPTGTKWTRLFTDALQTGTNWESQLQTNIQIAPANVDFVWAMSDQGYGFCVERKRE